MRLPRACQALRPFGAPLRGPAGAVTLGLCLLLLEAPAAAGKAKRDPPVAVEARYKERISKKLRASMSLASEHLAWSFGFQASGEDGGSANAGASQSFGLYELELEGGGRWLSRCETEIRESRDSITLCVLRKLQALTAFCEAEGAAAKYREGVLGLLKQLLGKRDAVVPGLGIKRALLPVQTGLEAWLCEKTPGSGDYDIMVAVHAAAMLAIVQCASSLGDRRLFSDVQSWFVAVEKVYPRNTWDKVSFHQNAILWESFATIASSIRRDSSFAEDISEFLGDFESYMQAVFGNDAKIWSYSGAHAAVLSWTGEKKAGRKKRLAQIVDEYIKRWKAIAPGLNVSGTYTCGPMQGIASLLLRRGSDAAELVGSVLKLAEKDVDLFQVSAQGGEPSAAAERVGADLLRTHGRALEGAFLRDELQLKREERWSVRIDDTAMCVLGLARTLRLVDDLIGIEVSEATADAADSAGASTESSSGGKAAGSGSGAQGEL